MVVAASANGKQASVGAQQARKALGDRNNMFRGRTKSWSHLVEEEAGLDDSNEDEVTLRKKLLQPHRYITRYRVKKISKSMSDLLQL